MQLYDRIARLEHEHASFAIATVVARRSPVSSHLGDRAIVFADGRMEGFVGGSCSRDIVRRQALAAIRLRRPLLLQIRPDVDASAEPVPADAERVVIPMSCTSEGAVDVYIEPRVPLRRLVIVGFTPVAEALARLAATLEYDVVRVVAEEESRDVDVDAAGGGRVIDVRELDRFVATLASEAAASLTAIVASQGHYDEAALEALLARPLAFVGLLASRRRATTVFGVLAQQGIAQERLATVRTPVGLDIGARSPGEVAISVLAEVIASGPAPSDAPVANEMPRARTGVDPVCGMDVDLETARHRATIDGRDIIFCCAGCRAAYLANPAAHGEREHA